MGKDIIRLRGMTFIGCHGVEDWERQYGHHFTVDLELYGDYTRPATSDLLEDTINYATVYSVVRTVVETESYFLIEHVAWRIMGKVFEATGVNAIRVCVSKHQPPVGGIMHTAEIDLFRTYEAFKGTNP